MAENIKTIDVLIFGGGVAGLWVLDELRRRGSNVLLLETGALGQGQTVASQGIIHGGLKYMFDGHLNAPAKAIAEMPGIWRECLAGQREPDLRETRVRSECCYIWGTGSLKSRLFLKGSTIALRAAPVAVEKAEWPAALSGVSGSVLKVPEQVIDAGSLMGVFAERNAGRILKIDGVKEPEFVRDGSGRVSEVRFFASAGVAENRIPSPGVPGEGEKASLVLRPTFVVFAAGAGNAGLRARAGLSAAAMQRRPLHMVMVRGELPELYGHCVGGPKPRVTITTVTDSARRRVWQVGGQIAEEGVDKSPEELATFARRELVACIPGLDLRAVEIGTYRVDRAEAVTTGGQRPDDAQIIRENNVITVWPTKLALAPRVAEVVGGGQLMGEVASCQLPVASGFSEVEVARGPWDLETEWF